MSSGKREEQEKWLKKTTTTDQMQQIAFPSFKYSKIHLTEAKMVTLPVGVFNACKCTTYDNYKDQEERG